MSAQYSMSRAASGLHTSPVVTSFYTWPELSARTRAVNEPSQNYDLCGQVFLLHVHLTCLPANLAKCLNTFLIVKALVGTFNNETALCEGSLTARLPAQYEHDGCPPGAAAAGPARLRVRAGHGGAGLAPALLAGLHGRQDADQVQGDQ